MAWRMRSGKEVILSVEHKSNCSRVSNENIQGKPARASQYECLRCSWNPPCRCCPGAAASGSGGQAEGWRRVRLRALDIPGAESDLLSSLRSSRELPNGERTSDAFLGEMLPSFLPNVGNHVIYYPNQDTFANQRRSS